MYMSVSVGGVREIRNQAHYKLQSIYQPMDEPFAVLLVIIIDHVIFDVRAPLSKAVLLVGQCMHDNK